MITLSRLALLTCALCVALVPGCAVQPTAATPSSTAPPTTENPLAQSVGLDYCTSNVRLAELTTELASSPKADAAHYFAASDLAGVLGLVAPSDEATQELGVLSMDYQGLGTGSYTIEDKGAEIEEARLRLAEINRGICGSG